MIVAEEIPAVHDCQELVLIKEIECFRCFDPKSLSFVCSFSKTLVRRLFSPLFLAAVYAISGYCLTCLLYSMVVQGASARKLAVTYKGQIWLPASLAVVHRAIISTQPRGISSHYDLLEAGLCYDAD